LTWIEGTILNNYGFSKKLSFIAQLMTPVLRSIYSLPEDCVVQITRATIISYYDKIIGMSIN
jgi:hypothetical protein